MQGFADNFQNALDLKLLLLDSVSNRTLRRFRGLQRQ
jgi:hypothetical protein